MSATEVGSGEVHRIDPTEGSRSIATRDGGFLTIRGRGMPSPEKSSPETSLSKRELQVVAVSAGSLLLVVPLSYVAVTGSVRTIDGWFGTSVFAGGLASGVLSIVAMGLALLVASIAVDVQFEGLAAMNGPGRRTAIDYAACWVVVPCGTIVAVDVAATVLGYGFGVTNGFVVLLLSVLVVLALVGTAIRTGRAFRAGVQERTALEH